MAKKILYSLAIFIIFLALLEAGAGLFESFVLSHRTEDSLEEGWQTKYFSSIFEWHEPDPDLLWRFKANISNSFIETNSEHYIGKDFDVEKKAGCLRILVLGDSSPVGLGLENYRFSFSEILKDSLAAALSDSGNLEIINASVSGYTSAQIKRFLEVRGWKLQPDIILLYCGNNDASISGTKTDRQLLEGQKFQTIRKQLYKTSIYRLMANFLTDKEQFDKTEARDLKVRVSPSEFAENLAAMANQCKQNDCLLVILKPAVPLLWPAGLQFKPFTRSFDSDGQVIMPEQMRDILGRELKFCLDMERFQRLYGTGDKFTKLVYSSAYTDSLTTVGAIDHYSELLSFHPNDAVIQNNLGVTYWEAKNYEFADKRLKKARQLFRRLNNESSSPVILSAGCAFLYNIGINLLSEDPSSQEGAMYLDSALQSDYLSLRIKREYWEAIDNLENHENVCVIDIPSLFRENGNELLFIDHCHPTAEGHRLIANEIISKLKKGCDFQSRFPPPSGSI